MATAGSIVLDLLLRTGSFETDSKRAEKAMRDLQKTAKSIGTSIGSSFAASVAGFAAGFLTIQSGLQLFGEAINQADRLDELSARLNVSTERLSEWGYAAKLTGTDLESLTGSLTKFSKNIASALDPNSSSAGVFKALGIDVKDADGRLKSVEALLPKVADKFKILDNTTLETALSMELFGKSGAELLEFLNNGSDGLDSFAKKARDLGIIISPDQAAAAAKFKDELDNLKAAGQGLVTKVSAELLPELSNLVKWASDFVKDGDNARQVADDIRVTVGALADAVRDSSEAFTSFKNALDLGDFGENAKSQLRGLVDFVGGTVTAFKGAYDEIAAIASFDRGGQLAAQRKQKDGQDRARAGLFGNTYVPPDAFKGVTSGFSTDMFKDVVGRASGKGVAAASAKMERERRELEGRVSKMFGGSGKSGKTDAEKQAERIEKSIREMTKAQREWQTELDGSGNPIIEAYGKRLDEITSKAEKFAADGVPKEKIEEFKKTMGGLAESIKVKEMAEFSENFAMETRELAASIDDAVSPALVRYESAVAELDKKLKSLRISQEEYSKRLTELDKQRNSAAIQMRKDFEFESELLGKTREEQERLNAARYLGVDAATAYGKAALDAITAYQSQRSVIDDQITAMDSLRDSARGFLHDLKDGENAWDALGNALDRFADKLFDLAADNLIEKILGQNGSTSGGSGGGWLSKLVGGFFSGGQSGGGGSGNWLSSLFGSGSGGGGWLSSLFGGGSSAPSSGFASMFGSNTSWLFGGAFAGGGQTMPDRAYLVGENGPEMFVPRTAGAVLPADMTRTALNGGVGGQVTFNNRQYYNGLPGRQTMQQSQTDLALQLRRQAGRNR